MVEEGNVPFDPTIEVPMRKVDHSGERWFRRAQSRSEQNARSAKNTGVSDVTSRGQNQPAGSWEPKVRRIPKQRKQFSKPPFAVAKASETDIAISPLPSSEALSAQLVNKTEVFAPWVEVEAAVNEEEFRSQNPHLPPRKSKIQIGTIRKKEPIPIENSS